MDTPTLTRLARRLASIARRVAVMNDLLRTLRRRDLLTEAEFGKARELGERLLEAVAACRSRIERAARRTPFRAAA